MVFRKQNHQDSVTFRMWGMKEGAGWPVYDLWPWTEPLTSGGEQEKVTLMVVGG